MGVSILGFNEVGKQFKGTVFALQKVSFRLEKGLHFLIGPNGAGKSTLLRIASTVIRPDAGVILHNGRDIYSDLLEYKFNLGYLPQVLNYYNHMTGREFLFYIAGLKGIGHRLGKERVDYVVELLRIQQCCTRKISTWSVGQKQRLGIAQSLLNNPTILILDEPFCGLDPEEANEIRRVLTQLSRNKLILISSHIMEGWLMTNLLFLVNGELKFTGSPTAFVDKAQGQVWLVEITKEDWFKIQHRYMASSVIFEDDCCRCKIINKNKPDISGAKAVTPELEDAYIFWLQHCK